MENSCPIELAPGESRIAPNIEKHEAALLLLLGFGGVSVVIALAYNALRKYVFKDVSSLDTVFDAGGRVSLSLTAVTVTSQMLWPAAFLHFSTLLSKSGIGGPLWTGIAIAADALLFPYMSLKLKSRAPGAKTYPQIIYARYGAAAHLVVCIFALATNFITMAGLLLAGKTAIEVLVKDVSDEFIMLVIAVMFGSYCLVGGLGTTFYISYFNTAITFIGVSIVIVKINYFPTPLIEQVASREVMYDAMSCVKGPDGNYENSLLTFRTRSGIINGIVSLFISLTMCLCDQANWQSRIATKPAQGVIGFLIAAFLWFVVPTSISFTIATVYISMSFQNGSHVLGQFDVDNGVITPYIMDTVLGPSGAYLLLTVLMMALMSTGSGEVMSVSSIIVYDIYKTHIRPFRQCATPTCCVLCLKDKAKHECECPSAVNCRACISDKMLRPGRKSYRPIQYSCSVHGLYRQYEDSLVPFKNWCMVFVILLLVPLGLVITKTGMSLFWVVMVGGLVTSSAFVQILLTISWAKSTAAGVIAGSISGFLASLAALLAFGSTYDGGLSNFFINTTQENSLIGGLTAGLVVSTIVSIVTSLCTTTVKTAEDEMAEWMKTTSIDNPLNPYRTLYAEELEAINAGPVITSDTMARIFRRAQKWAYIGGGVSMVLFLVVIPAVALGTGVLSRGQFNSWLSVIQVLCFIATFFVVVVPPIEEGLQIFKQLRLNKDKEKTDKLTAQIRDFDTEGGDESAIIRSAEKINMQDFTKYCERNA